MNRKLLHRLGIIVAGPCTLSQRSRSLWGLTRAALSRSVCVFRDTIKATRDFFHLAIVPLHHSACVSGCIQSHRKCQPWIGMHGQLAGGDRASEIVLRSRPYLAAMPSLSSSGCLQDGQSSLPCRRSTGTPTDDVLLELRHFALHHILIKSPKLANCRWTVMRDISCCAWSNRGSVTVA